MAVHKLKPNYTKKFNSADAVMSTIRWEMYDHDIKDMAAYIGVSPSCIYAIRRGKTLWPRPKAFFGLIEYLNLELTVRKL